MLINSSQLKDLLINTNFHHFNTGHGLGMDWAWSWKLASLHGYLRACVQLFTLNFIIFQVA